LLERPWRNATTGELLSRMEWHAGLAGNAYVVRQSDRLRVLRPDFVAVVYGSDREPEDPMHALDGEVIGYAYQNGGIRPDNNSPLETLLPEDVAHWSPIPDPESPAMGISWVTAALREIQGDRAATEHKLRFFDNGATPSMVVKGIPATTKEQFDELVGMMESRHAGVANAYRTLYLTAGADATVVGADMKQLDFKATQGAGETRIALLGGVPAVLLGISEGLAGSSLNAGNFGMARRIFADIWLYPTLQDVAAALSPVVDVPGDAELWFDTADIPLLREDGKDAADIESVKGATVTAYVREGFTADSAVKAVNAGDITLLRHTGNVSVQLQPPGTGSNGGTDNAGDDAGDGDQPR
jgi:phage portal protein BeeE